MTTDQKKTAEDRERPRPDDANRSGFMGNRGQVDPTPPGGRNPGGPAAQPPRDRDDYHDYPLDPEVPGPADAEGGGDARSRPLTDQQKKTKDR